MRLAFTGDIYVPHSFAKPPVLGPHVTDLLRGCTGVIANFEGPLDPGQGVTPAFKTGPNLRQHAETLRYLTASGVTAVTLANNHSADFGEDVLRHTADAADALGLQVAGLLQDGQIRSAEWQGDGLRVRVLAFAEQEWSGEPSANTRVAIFNLADAARAIIAAKQSADAVIVNLHGNNEHSPLPNPQFANQARFLVESGADAVIVHHAHRISGVEIHRDRPILYGLGNFQFCTPALNAHWHQGVMAILGIKRQGGTLSVTHELHPVLVDPESYSTELADPEMAKHLENDIAALSQIIASPASLQAHFEAFVQESQTMYQEFLNPFASKGRIGRLVGRVFVKRMFLRRRRHAMLLNALRCDAHREALTRDLTRRLEE